MADRLLVDGSLLNHTLMAQQFELTLGKKKCFLSNVNVCSVLVEQWIRAKYERGEFTGDTKYPPLPYTTGNTNIHVFLTCLTHISRQITKQEEQVCCFQSLDDTGSK